MMKRLYVRLSFLFIFFKVDLAQERNQMREIRFSRTHFQQADVGH